MKIWWKFFGKSFSTSDKNWKEEKKSCVKKSSSSKERRKKNKLKYFVEKKERKREKIWRKKLHKKRSPKSSCSQLVCGLLQLRLIVYYCPPLEDFREAKNNNNTINMAEVEIEESFETTTVRKKTVRQSFKIQEVSTIRKKSVWKYRSIINLQVLWWHFSPLMFDDSAKIFLTFFFLEQYYISCTRKWAFCCLSEIAQRGHTVTMLR